jgi:hypothetical protein
MRAMTFRPLATKRLFISYAHEDRPFVERLAAALEHLGYTL